MYENLHFKKVLHAVTFIILKYYSKSIIALPHACTDLSNLFDI